jgi:integrase
MAFMKSKSYNINTTGKIINLFKTMLACAEEDGYPVNPAFRYKSFKGQRVLVDTIYLTRQDLKKMMAVNLSKMDPCYAKARDIFMIGVWTAQRVSDYNHLTKENLSEQVIRKKEKNGSYTERTVKTLTFVQQKTGNRVIIPCCKELCKTLDKYPDEFPFLWDQKLNKYIKEIGKRAGLTDPVEVTTTKGGKIEKAILPKYELITTHTARRTGATLMYLAGMDVFDICKFTGHSDVQTLLRYIRADELETFKKVTEHYDYFDLPESPGPGKGIDLYGERSDAECIGFACRFRPGGGI